MFTTKMRFHHIYPSNFMLAIHHRALVLRPCMLFHNMPPIPSWPRMAPVAPTPSALTRRLRGLVCAEVVHSLQVLFEEPHVGEDGPTLERADDPWNLIS